MAKRPSSDDPVKSPRKSAEPPARRPIFRFADVGRGVLPLGSHTTIHGAD